MRLYRRRRINSRVFFVLIIVLAVVLLFYLIFTVRLVPIIKSMAVSNARNIATQTINSAAGKVLKNENISYDKLMTLEKDKNGAITAVKENTLQIDLLKYEITDEALKELNHIDSSKLEVPIGTVIGGQIFTGVGPRINVKVEPVGSVETEIENEFTSAGINQTRQQVTLNVKTTINIMVSSYTMTTTVKSNFLLADTVIVGKVPSSYLVVEGDSGNSTSDKIFKYGKNNSSSSK